MKLLIAFIIWSLCVVYALYYHFDTKINNLNNLVEVHAHTGYYIACMEETRHKYKCMDRAKKYTQEAFKK